MNRRELFRGIIGAPIAAKLAANPDVIDWGKSRPLQGDISLSDGALGRRGIFERIAAGDDCANEYANETLEAIERKTLRSDLVITINGEVQQADIDILMAQMNRQLELDPRRIR